MGQDISFARPDGQQGTGYIAVECAGIWVVAVKLRYSPFPAPVDFS